MNGRHAPVRLVLRGFKVKTRGHMPQEVQLHQALT